MAEEWLTITELARRVEIAENTARRYAKLFDGYIKSRKYGRTIKYDPEALQVLASVSQLYKDGLGTQEIHERLGGVYALHVEADSALREMYISRDLPEISETMAAMTEHIKRQEQFNQELLRRLEERDQKLMDTLHEIREHRLAIAATVEDQKKPWWKWW